MKEEGRGSTLIIKRHSQEYLFAPFLCCCTGDVALLPDAAAGTKALLKQHGTGREREIDRTREQERGREADQGRRGLH